MPKNFYSVYALRDQRTGRLLYEENGIGIRAQEPLIKPDGTRKSKRIDEIKAAGQTALVDFVLPDLTEHQAERVEAALIAMLGTEGGGEFTRAVVPKKFGSTRVHVEVPPGSFERTQFGLDRLKKAVVK